MPNAIVTGANRGIGLELARGLKASGHEVVAACRKRSPELDALDVTVIEGIDVTDDASVARLVDAAPAQVDVLVNNAGIMQRTAVDEMDFESCAKQFAVNSIGPLRVTLALRQKLADGSKVAVVTSRMGSMADNTSGGAYGYRMSKAAVNMGFTSLAHDLKPDGVAVAILHPGWVKTEMTGNTGHVTAAESAAGLLARIDGLTIEKSGTFWHQNGEVLPW